MRLVRALVETVVAAIATATGRGLSHQVEVILCQYFAALDQPRNAIECDPWDKWAQAEHRWP
jgi:hypothetical protein